MTNSQIAAAFQEMSVLLELAGENPFRVRAYQRATQTIAGLPKPVSGIPPAELLDIPGIGKGIASHIEELFKAGSMAELETLRKRFPQGLLDLIGVPGLGPKRAKLLFEQLGIDSLAKLRRSAETGRLKTLPGFGAKLEENILRGLAFTEQASKRTNYWDARMTMDDLLEAMRGAPGVDRISPAGSLRRGRESVGDLDLLCTARDGAAVVEFFTHLSQVERVMAAGTYDCLVIDIRLPGRSGISLLQELRARGIFTPAILITAFNSVEYSREALNANANYLLEKPFSFAALTYPPMSLVSTST